MGDAMWVLMNAVELAWVLKIAMLAMIVGLVAYAFSKEGRDERGRANIGTACIWGLVVLFVASNVYSSYTVTILENGPIVFTNAYCLVGSAFLLTLWVALLVLRKIR